MNEQVHEHFACRLAEELCITDQFAPNAAALQLSPRVCMGIPLDGCEIGKRTAAVAQPSAPSVPLRALFVAASTFIGH
jgi:hypothetical protein